MIVGLCFFVAITGANGFYFGLKMSYLLQGADYNAQVCTYTPLSRPYLTPI